MDRLLVVDDDPAVTRELSVQLTGAGFDVLVANDADSASQLAIRKRPDLILLDLDMPRYTGLELHQALQFSERGQRIPVVFLVDAENSSHHQALKQGAKAVIRKPPDFRELIETVRAVIRHAAAALQTHRNPARTA